MKIALVHELLTMKGGAERVLRIAAALFPEAPIYTLLYNEAVMGDWFPRERVRAAALPTDHFPLPTGFRFNHHLLLPFFPRAVESWDFSEYDVVLSFSSAFAHGIITNGAPRHVCYVQSPARYLWDRTHDVLERAGKGMVGPLRRAYLSRAFHRLRVWDAESAARPDVLLAASAEVRRRIGLYWERESTVLHPPVDDHWFTSSHSPRPTESSGRALPADRSSYLIVSTLVPYKRIELAIEACNQLNVPLTIAGQGPAQSALRAIAGPTISFVGFQSDDGLRRLYAGARATLFPGEEDFGLVPLESMACGTPVIAFRGGGALETVTDATGAFFDSPAAATLAETIARFDPTRYSADACRAQAKRFARARFEEGLLSHVGAAAASAATA